MVNPENLSILHDQTGHADDPQRVLFRTFLQDHGCRTMLDCGAGPGWEYDALRENGISIAYTGLEITKLFFDQLVNRGVKTIQASVESIPLPDSSYEVVYCRQVLEHVGDFKRAVREMIRVASRFVYIAMNKDFGNKTIIKKQYGLWHNVYALTEFWWDTAAENKVNEIESLGLKSYLIRLNHEN